MLQDVVKKLFPIRDENNQPCTFPTFASQVFMDDGTPVSQEIQKLNGQKAVELDATLTQDGKAADAKATGDSLEQIKQKIASKNYTLNVSVISNKVTLVSSTPLIVSGNFGYFRIAFHVRGSVSNQEGIFTITGFPKNINAAKAFLAKGLGKVFFSADITETGNSMTIISNAGNDQGEWFYLPIIVFLDDD